ncbi:MAG: hypothetical protein ACREBK_07660 [Sphingomicrobium sp.]
MKPRFPIDTPAKVTQAREYLGLDKAALARALRMEGVGGRDRVRRWEEGRTAGIDGPVQIALEKLVDDKGAAK